MRLSLVSALQQPVRLHGLHTKEPYEKSAKDCALRTIAPSDSQISLLVFLSLPFYKKFLAFFPCDIVMVRSLALPATLLSLYFVTPSTSLLSTPFLSEAPPMNVLEPRQAPAVIATSEFLRRDYQACEC